jgi:maltose alpha-D-glucosyltransferase/alpha-amylase
VSAAPWYRDAVFYQLRIPSFYDADGDGIGDLPGLTAKLDYLAELGVTALWLLPFYPSPLRDDGYDIADYQAVHPDLGTLRDFRTFLREAHRRGLRVVTELVLNHTSDEHAWFQRARRAPPGSRARDFYVWSDVPTRYADARVIFKDFETSNWAWDPVARAYYWHRFYSHQPDLNFDHPEVRQAVLRVVDFWLELGVDGLRLDAVPYLFEREGTSCENLPETHAFLRELRAHVDAAYPERMLLAEANQWPEDAIAYFGKGDECQMAFHFPLMPRLFLGIHMEDRFPILDVLEQTPPIPETCQWALFLRNHDELTLEMVTDEERDYMWRVYARERRARINLGIRRRLAPLLGNSRRKIELMNALLFSLPGTPIVYYGDEIGMGDNVYLGDRNGVRTPMQWSADRNAGFSRANPQKLVLPVIEDPEYSHESVNVETQQANPSSLLWWMKRILALRRRHPAFGRGRFEALSPANRRVLAFLRRHGEECLLVVANLSRFSQYAELDLSEFAGCQPVELFGRTAFPRIGELPYLLTLGPHAFYWFAIEAPRPALEVARERSLPELSLDGSWESALEGEARARLEAALPGFLTGRRWFRSKARPLRRARVTDCVRLELPDEAVRLALLEVEFAEGPAEAYVLPLRFAAGAGEWPGALARVRLATRQGERVGVLEEASGHPGFAKALLDALARRRRLRGRSVELRGQPTRRFRELAGEGSPTARPLGVEQTNTSWRFGERLVGKLLRRLDEGESPELELSRHLSERAGYRNAAPLAGWLELVRGREEPVATLALFHGWIPNEGDAWSFTLDQIELYLETVAARRDPALPPPGELLAGPLPEETGSPLAPYLELARLLGRRTGELHRALASDVGDPAFVPEPVTPFSQRAAYQALRSLAVRVFDRLNTSLAALPDALRPAAQALLEREADLLGRLREDADVAPGGWLVRCHGDYHLGQLLYTGGDFHVIDFEGEPARSLAERRRKRSALADVAGMLRSFDYATRSVLADTGEGGRLRPEDAEALRPWARHWTHAVSRVFLASYLESVAPARLLPEDPERLRRSLDLHLLEKILYELGYELDNRPEWVAIPLSGLLERLTDAEPGMSGRPPRRPAPPGVA